MIALLTLCVYLFIAFLVFKTTYFYYRRVRFPSRWKVFRFIRTLRKCVNPPRISMFLYSASLIIMLIGLAATAIDHQMLVLKTLLPFIVAIMMAATTFDVFFRVRELLKYSLFRFLFKWSGYYISAIVVLSSLVVSKKIIHLISGADPAYFSDFVRLVSVVVAPLIFCCLISCMLILAMVMKYFFIMVAFLISSLLRFFLTAFPWGDASKYYGYQYRIIYGHRLPKSISDAMLPGLFTVMRFFGIALLVAMIGFPIYFENLLISAFQQYATSALVWVEYRENHFCTGVDAKDQLAYLPDGFVSVATFNQNDYQFSIKKCMKD